MTVAALAMLPATFAVCFIVWQEWRWRTLEGDDDAAIAKLKRTRGH